MDCSILYVSQRRLVPGEEQTQIDAIIAVARRRNAELRVTGTLVATHDHFAQALEGPAKAICALMASITLDARHTDVTILRQGEIARRAFPAWSMAYSGPSSYIARHIAPLIGEVPLDDAWRVDRLVRLLTELSSS